MKNTASLLLSMALSIVTANAQDVKTVNSGRITFEEKAKLEIKLEGDAAQFADNLPKEQVSTRLLYFDQHSSLYLNVVKNEDDMMNNESGTVKIRMINGGENDKTYSDLSEMRTTEEKEFMTRKFLVVGGEIKNGWKIKDSFGNILGYNCQEATMEDSVRTIRAWFTTAIPVQSGPAGLGGLPGIILKIDINNGKRVITAVSIEPGFDVTALLVKPKDGKKVSQDEFKKIVDDKRKEMGVENGDGTNHIVIKYRN